MPINSPTWLKRLLTRDKGLKILSILLAVITWYSIRGITGVTKTINDIPIVVKAREGITVLAQERDTVSVTFQGSQSDISQLEDAQGRGQIQAVVYSKIKKVTDAVEHESIPILPRSIEGGKGARVTKVSRPSAVSVTLDRENEKQVMVRPKCKGIPGVGRVMSVACNPASVRVRGAEHKLGELEVINTEPVDLSDAEGSFSKTMHLVSPGFQWISSIEPREVLVTVSVERAAVSRKIADLPVTAMVRPSQAVSIEVLPARVNVVLTGNNAALEKITKGDIRVIVDCSELELAAKYDLPVSVNLPQGVDISAVAEPARVQAVLKPMR